MEITREEARRIAALAHIEMDEPALDRIAAEMTKILTYIDQLKEVDVAGFEDRPEAEATPMREDTPHAPLERELVSRNAPAWSDGFFVVPKVIGE
jgi:aspartyl-tRNA(Asn)/glutamyl-tRNA(Gln) amidotransferase subunit C